MKNNQINLLENMNTKLTVREASMLSPLQLAYIGDAVYELLIRTYLLQTNKPVHELHKEAVHYVKARAQSEIVHLLAEDLTECEKTIVKRGRNTKTYSSPKNADIIDYKYATGFESLVGFLYLTGQNDRLLELFERIVSDYEG